MEQTLSITPFSSQIIGADSKFLYIKEMDLSDESWYVLKVRHPMFIKMVRLWIGAKADYCKKYGHFCGVFGNFFIKEGHQIGEINILLEIDEEDNAVYKNVPLIEVIAFDEYCDMEHG